MDHENLLNLFQIEVLKSNSLTSSLEKKLWNYLNKSIDTNIKGINGKQWILSIVANKFKYEELELELKVNS